MTDKQIIIDGVDVSECEYLYTDSKYNDKCCSASIGGNCLCKPSEMICVKYVECLKEQLKHKEQELQEAMDNYVKLDNQRVKEYNELVDKYNNKEQELEQYKASKQASYEALQKKCNELELEKRKLKERLDQWISKCEQETKLKEFHKNETDEYKNTLLYIKEIAEVQQSWNEVNRQISETEFEDDIFAWNWSALKQILNKISEVLKDEV